MIVKNVKYLDWIRKKNCLVQRECLGPIQADHLQARGTGSHKQVDYFAIPLCEKHHGERHIRGNTWFQSAYSVDLWREVALLIVEWIVKKDENLI